LFDNARLVGWVRLHRFEILVQLAQGAQRVGSCQAHAQATPFVVREVTPSLEGQQILGTLRIS
jgi:hypothetical protein